MQLRLVFSVFFLMSVGMANIGCQPVGNRKFDYAMERAAIQAVIRAETNSYYTQDMVAWKSSFLDSTSFRMHAHSEDWPEKVRSCYGFQTFMDEKRAHFEDDKTLRKGSTVMRKNENIRITYDMSLCTFEQYLYEEGTNKFLGRSLETRVLEKHTGQWKITYLGSHYFPSLPESYLPSLAKPVRLPSAGAGRRY